MDGNSLAISGYGYDPYFMAAFQSYNPNFKGTTDVQQANKTAQTSSSSASGNATSQKKSAPENKKSNAGLVLGGIATVGAAVLLYKAHKKGGEKGISEGLKQIWQGITNRGRGEAEKEVFKISQENGKWYAQIPRRRQVISPAEADKLGIKLSAEVPKLGEAGTELKAIEFIHDGNKFIVKGDGTLLRYENSARKDLLETFTKSTETADVEYKKTIAEIISKLRRGESVDGVDIQKMYYTHTKDGVTRKYLQKHGESTASAYGNIRTNRFTLDSDAVVAYGAKNSGVEEVIAQIKGGKVPETLKIANATYKVDSTNALIIKDGKIIGLDNGKFHNTETDAFIAYKKKHPDVFKDVENLHKDKKLTNIVYAV